MTTNDTTRSYLTGEPLTKGQWEFNSRYTRTVGETFRCATGAVYRVLAVRKPQSLAQLILVEEVR